MSCLRPAHEDQAITDTARRRPGFVHLRVRSAYSLLEGAIKADKIGKLAAGGGHAGRGAHRPGQSVRRAGVLRRHQGRGRPADHRLRPAGHRHRRGAARALGQDADHRAAGPERAGLSQPLRPVVRGLSGRRRRPTSRSVPWAKVVRARRGADPAVRRPGRAGRSPVRRRQGRGGRARRWPRCTRVFGDRFYVELQRHGLPAEAAAEPGWWPSPTTTTCRWSPPTTSISPSRRMHAGARRPAVHRRRRLHRPGRAPPGHRRALVQAGRRHARAVRRPAGGLRQHPRYRPPLRLHGRPSATRSCRASPPAAAAPRPTNWPTRPARA